MLSTLERKIEFLPAWDRRAPEPSKNYGVHSVEMRWYVIGKKGVVQFVVYTNWMLPHVQSEQDARPVIADFPHLTCRPIAADVGYHSPTPTYEGQQVMTEACELLGGRPCYYDGSGLAAEDVFQKLVAEGGDAVWAELEYRWHCQFEPAELESLGL